MGGRFRVITLGCKVNQYESAFLEEVLTRAGWSLVREGQRSDLVIVNTCIVTQRASHQSRQEIRKALRRNPGSLVAAVGCYAQVFPEELSRIGGVRLIVDNRRKREFARLVPMALRSEGRAVFLGEFEEGMAFDCLEVSRFSGRTRAFLKIQDGCEAFCSYCIVPSARGPYRSLPPAEVLHMVESLAENGHKEIVLTGIHLGMYGVDLTPKMDLKDLLRQIGKEKFPLRIRMSSLEPNEIDSELIEMVASEGWLCRHFHIPLQSGDDRILRRMNRRYTAAAFERLVGSIHDSITLVAIGVDVMAGFPGEDMTAHNNTCTLLNDLPVAYLHVFPFSPRKGTAAAKMDGQVAPAIIKKRSAELRELGAKKRGLFYDGCVGEVFEVLSERWHLGQEEIMEGRSDNYLPVRFPFPGGGTGRFVPVRVELNEASHLRGEVYEADFPLFRPDAADVV